MSSQHAEGHGTRDITFIFDHIIIIIIIIIFTRDKNIGTVSMRCYSQILITYALLLLVIMSLRKIKMHMKPMTILFDFPNSMSFILRNKAKFFIE